MNFVEELKWRGMIHDMTPGTEEQIKKALILQLIPCILEILPQ